MKLALSLPNFRDKVTVDELEDLRGLAEDRCAVLCVSTTRATAEFGAVVLRPIPAH